MVQNSRLVGIFFFQYFKYLLYSLLACIISSEKSSVILILVPFQVKWARLPPMCTPSCPPTSGFFQDFIYLFIFAAHIQFSQVWFLPGSVIWCFLSLSLECSWPLFKYFFSVLSPFSFWYSSYASVKPFAVALQVLDGLFFLFPILFSLFISVWKVCIDLSLSLLIYPLAVSSLLMSPSQHSSFLLQ